MDEKSRQIPLMARIFHAASRVLVWLGNGENEGSDTITWLSRLTRMSSIIHEHAGDLDFLKARLEGLFATNWPRIVRLVCLPWFSRRWVIQEVVLNTDVCLYCGSSKISWPRFILAMEIWSKWRDSFAVSGPPLKPLLKLGYLWRAWSLLDGDPKECDLLDLLDAFSHFKCAEENDKVYALVGLATDVRTNLGQSTAPGMTITIDYSMPIEAVFRMVALQRMSSGRVFSTLAEASARRLVRSTRSSHRLLSWVPDLEVKRRHNPIIHDSQHLSPPNVTFIKSDMCLLLNGAVRDLNQQLKGLTKLVTSLLGAIEEQKQSQADQADRNEALARQIEALRAERKTETEEMKAEITELRAEIAELRQIIQTQTTGCSGYNKRDPIVC
jgi:hypothetical protein